MTGDSPRLLGFFNWQPVQIGPMYWDGERSKQESYHSSTGLRILTFGAMSGIAGGVLVGQTRVGCLQPDLEGGGWCKQVLLVNHTYPLFSLFFFVFLFGG